MSCQVENAFVLRGLNVYTTVNVVNDVLYVGRLGTWYKALGALMLRRFTYQFTPDPTLPCKPSTFINPGPSYSKYLPSLTQFTV